MRCAMETCATVLLIVFVVPAQALDVLLEHITDIRVRENENIFLFPAQNLAENIQKTGIFPFHPP
jgi:hypothetical protein